MSKLVRLTLAVHLLMSCEVFAAVFIVPDDAELIRKSAGVVTGVVVDSLAAVGPSRDVETAYTVRIDRAFKGGFGSGSVIKVVSPGGIAGSRMTYVSGAAHFAKGDKVLLFLTKDARNAWTPTDMTLGKFRFVTSTGGQSLLVRDEEDVIGFDRSMRTHVERIRREADFLSFIDDRVHGRSAQAAYFIAPGEAISIPHDQSRLGVSSDAVFAPRSYSIQFTDGVTNFPGRWPDVTLNGGTVPVRMSATVARPFFKASAQSASGLGDGGVALITSALNAWTSDCPSAVNIVYGGLQARLKNPDDEVNVVVWNDPGGHIAGSWVGAGVIATAFMSGDFTHTFNGETDWIALSDSDVVVQDGIIGTEGFVATAMTHELGHAIGLRHSNTHHDGTACLSSDDCTGTAVMNSSVSTAWNFSLQPWDQSAIRALYPASCSITPRRNDFDGDGKADILLRDGSGTLGMYLMNGAAITTGGLVGSPGGTYGVGGIGDFGGDGKADILLRDNLGNLGLWTMNGLLLTGGAFVGAPGAYTVAGVADFSGDGKSDILLRDSTGTLGMWVMNGAAITTGALVGSPGGSYTVAATADFNGDGKADILLRDSSGTLGMWIMNGPTLTSGHLVGSPGGTYTVAAASDFSGDGKADILLRDSLGNLGMWIMNGHLITSGAFVGSPGGYTVSAANDYSGDGKADILLRDASGSLGMWIMNGSTISSGSFVASPGSTYVAF